ncbi:MAG: hypothetical protein FJ143_16375 [Deltaproteobacteria bacterium]|nr:hypothetical protein [Deltaproteobacteria bacterium]
MLELIEVLFFFLEVIVEIVFAFGFEKRSDAYGRPLFRYSPWMYLGLAMLGACVGSLMSQFVPQRILPTPMIRGASLFLSPLVAGLVMKWFGDWRTNQGHQPTVLATFWGGAAFAFGMAFVRWMMVGRVL